jgi:Predicted redox protein, regulator of disulfide bond formation
MSTYTAKIAWKSDSSEAFATNQYSRAHEWSFDGGISVPASSSAHSVRLPYSVEEAVDPEEALVAAAASCHMLSFLWVVSKRGFVVESYEDNAVGEMTKNDQGKEWISTIRLDPQIVWGENVPSARELADMHHTAHEHCYIANTIKSEIIVKGVADAAHLHANR